MASMLTRSHTTNRNTSIDSLRGLAVILMVAGHVIGSSASRGLEAADGSGWRLIYQALEDIRMPLFTVLSGFIYAYRPLSTLGGYPRLIRGKARRLLVPMITVGTLFFFVQLVVSDTNAKPEPSEYWRVFFFSNEHLWFVQAIFLIFLVVGLLSALNLLKKRRQLVVAILATSVLFVMVPTSINLFSIGGAARLLPFFLLGYGLHYFASPTRSSVVIALGVAFGAIFAVRLWALLGDINIAAPAFKVISLAVGILAVTLLVLVRERIQVGFLTWLGPFAFGIYLLHVFGSAGARVVLGRFGIEDNGLMFAVCLLLAIFLPVLFELVTRHSVLISWGIFGQKPRGKVLT
ncbi:acyltransferase family protein [Arthrobacter sp. RIT-PI-e]|uniref:acyltransferase family protein n=1 Tax=Arthrobacter sp. RIT-PI-e TaxID=1681197 RepID=UPI0009E2B4EC|nr:acyltransferase [Arthrobacter sp. RIT-PI-e]